MKVYHCHGCNRFIATPGKSCPKCGMVTARDRRPAIEVPSRVEGEGSRLECPDCDRFFCHWDRKIARAIVTPWNSEG
jgi:uncharacterized protein with PIN domain